MPQEMKTVKVKLKTCYKTLRHAIFQRTEMVQEVTRQDVAHTNSKLRANYVDILSMSGDLMNGKEGSFGSKHDIV